MQIASHLLLHSAVRDGGRSRRRRITLRRSPSSTQLAKRGGGPQDRAFYTCGCGAAFTATVSTTVGCPHCGTAQAW